MNWTALGKELKASALDAHDGQLPHIDIAYSFLLDNAECFSDSDEWPADMPQEPNIEIIAAYYGETYADCPDCHSPFDEDGNCTRVGCYFSDFYQKGATS